MATTQEVKRTAALAIAVGVGTMALSNGVASSSIPAGATAFVIGLAVTSVGAMKFWQAAKSRG